MIMKEFTYTIKDEQGIHARPAGELVKAAAAYPCKVTISKDGKEVDAKRILGVMPKSCVSSKMESSSSVS